LSILLIFSFVSCDLFQNTNGNNDDDDNDDTVNEVVVEMGDFYHDLYKITYTDGFRKTIYRNTDNYQHINLKGWDINDLFPQDPDTNFLDYFDEIY